MAQKKWARLTHTKVQKLQDWPVADLHNSMNNSRPFVGLAGYFRKSVSNFPALVAPLLQRSSFMEHLPWAKAIMVKHL